MRTVMRPTDVPRLIEFRQERSRVNGMSLHRRRTRRTDSRVRSGCFMPGYFSDKSYRQFQKSSYPGVYSHRLHKPSKLSPQCTYLYIASPLCAFVSKEKNIPCTVIFIYYPLYIVSLAEHFSHISDLNMISLTFVYDEVS